MAEALQFEKADEHGNPIKCLTGTLCPLQKPRQTKKQCTDVTEVVVSSDEDNHNYQDMESVKSVSTSPSESDSVTAAYATIMSRLGVVVTRLLAAAFWLGVGE
jgi:hypothetical protein